MFRECKDKTYTGRKFLKKYISNKRFVTRIHKNLLLFNNNKIHNLVTKRAKKNLDNYFIKEDI